MPAATELERGFVMARDHYHSAHAPRFENPLQINDFPS